MHRTAQNTPERGFTGGLTPHTKAPRLLSYLFPHQRAPEGRFLGGEQGVGSVLEAELDLQFTASAPAPSNQQKLHTSGLNGGIREDETFLTLNLPVGNSKTPADNRRSRVSPSLSLKQKPETAKSAAAARLCGAPEMLAGPLLHLFRILGGCFSFLRAL